jgi:hypothetical protein
MSLADQGVDFANLPALVMKYILPWFEATGETIRIGRQVVSGLATEGTYEVLEYSIRLELKDPEGKKAIVRKQEKVKYLQNNIIAFQDQAWGDGKILQNYQCKPGVPVDKYRSGYKTHILISLREVKNQGDIDEFNIQWGVSRGFLSPTGFWGTDVDHRTASIKVEVVYPKSRPPMKASVLEKNLQRVSVISQDHLIQLPDGRWQLAWEQPKPRRYEQYILRWKW